MEHPPIASGLTPDERRVHEATLEWFAAVEGPGLGRVTAGWDPDVTADGRTLAFTGLRRVSLDQRSQTTIALVDPATGALRTAGDGCHDRAARWSPDGRRLAFLSDRGAHGTQRLVWTGNDDLDALTDGPALPGSPEFLAWSPDGARLLVVVRQEESGGDGPSWWPSVDRPAAPTGWRELHVIEVATGAARRVSASGWTVWEAVWAGNDAVAAVVSSAPGEEAWYGARAALFQLPETDGLSVEPRILHETEDQVGRPSASPSGRRIAVVQSFSSDRSLVAGDLMLLDAAGGAAVRLDTLGTDVAFSAFRDETHLFFIGVRGQRTVAGETDLATGVARELWGTDGSTSGVYPRAVQDAAGTLYALAESYRCPPRAVAVTDGEERVLADLAHDGSAHLLAHAGELRRVQWTAPDGLQLDGFLVTPPASVASAPYPTVIDIHGGPVWTWHDQWGMRGATGAYLASRGYAVLYPNQRGGTGKGQEFARAILRDMHGADTADFQSAVDALVADGITDPARVGVTGTSYGGSLALWLITQSAHFAASVAVSGISDWVSFHHTTTIADFDHLFVPGEPLDPAGEYVRRSPLTHVDRVQTPVLMITGQLDADVPASQSMEFHRALTMRGKVSEWVRYPEEGHVVGDFPAVADAVARTVAWFERHMPANPAPPAERAG